MGEDFPAFIVGGEEANDLTMAGAAVKMIIAVEDHILRALKLAQADIFGARNAVVEGIGRGRLRQRRLGLAHLVIDRRHINFVEHLIAVLQPADIEGHRGCQHQTQHHLIGAGAIAEADQAIVHDQHDDGAHDALGYGAPATTQTVAADHRRSDGQDLEVQSGAGTGTAQSAGDEEAGDP